MRASPSELEPTPRRHAVGSTSLILVGLLLAGLFLRFRALAFQSLWNDELASWHMAHWPTISQVLTRGVIPEVNVVRTTLQALSAVLGGLAIPVIYQLGRTLYSRREGVVAAALLTVSWLPIYYSQEARPYALVILTGHFAARSMNGRFDEVVSILEAAQ